MDAKTFYAKHPECFWMNLKWHLAHTDAGDPGCNTVAMRAAKAKCLEDLPHVFYHKPSL